MPPNPYYVALDDAEAENAPPLTEAPIPQGQNYPAPESMQAPPPGPQPMRGMVPGTPGGIPQAPTLAAPTLGEIGQIYQSLVSQFQASLAPPPEPTWQDRLAVFGVAMSNPAAAAVMVRDYNDRRAGFQQQMATIKANALRASMDLAESRNALKEKQYELQMREIEAQRLADQTRSAIEANNALAELHRAQARGLGAGGGGFVPPGFPGSPGYEAPGGAVGTPGIGFDEGGNPISTETPTLGEVAPEANTLEPSGLQYNAKTGSTSYRYTMRNQRLSPKDKIDLANELARSAYIPPDTTLRALRGARTWEEAAIVIESLQAETGGGGGTTVPPR